LSTHQYLHKKEQVVSVYGIKILNKQFYAKHCKPRLKPQESWFLYIQYNNIIYVGTHYANNLNILCIYTLSLSMDSTYLYTLFHPQCSQCYRYRYSCHQCLYMLLLMHSYAFQQCTHQYLHVQNEAEVNIKEFI